MKSDTSYVLLRIDRLFSTINDIPSIGNALSRLTRQKHGYTTINKTSIFVFILSCFAATAASAQTLSFRAARDFSYSNGGVFTYGYGVTGDKASFKKYGPLIDGCGEPPNFSQAEGVSDCFREGDALIGLSRGLRPYVIGTVLVRPQVLFFHPGVGPGVDSILKFSAPFAGEFEFTGFYEILDGRPNTSQPKVFVNAKEITRDIMKSEGGAVRLNGQHANLDRMSPGQRLDFRFKATLKKKGAVWFGLNDDGDYRSDATGFELTVRPVNSSP